MSFNIRIIIFFWIKMKQKDFLVIYAEFAFTSHVYSIVLVYLIVDWLLVSSGELTKPIF